MSTSYRANRLALAVATLLLGACSDLTDTPPATPPSLDGPPRTEIAITCRAEVANRSVTCGMPAPGDLNRLILGGQNQYVKLTSSNIAIVADTFAFDVTVQNLIPQALGTTDGTTSDPSGVRVFFHAGPTPNAGTASVANEDGTATFTAAGQPYFQYNGRLPQDSTTAAKRWKLQFAGASSFTFTVYVSAAVQYPIGYVDGNYYVLTLDPSEGRTLPGNSRSAVGNIDGDAITWGSSAPATVSVAGSTATAGPSRGTATLTPNTGLGRPALFNTIVSVCESTVVTNGHSSAQSIANTDCFSSYGSNAGTPSTSYYADLYRVTLTAGQTVTVTMDSGDDLDTYLLMAGPAQGFLVAGNDDDDLGLLGVGSRMVYTATVTGVYVIEASTFNGLDTGNYTLGITIS